MKTPFEMSRRGDSRVLLPTRLLLVLAGMTVGLVLAGCASVDPSHAKAQDQAPPDLQFVSDPTTRIQQSRPDLFRPISLNNLEPGGSAIADAPIPSLPAAQPIPPSAITQTGYQPPFERPQMESLPPPRPGNFERLPSKPLDGRGQDSAAQGTTAASPLVASLGMLACSPQLGFPGSLPWAAIFTSSRTKAYVSRPGENEPMTLHMDDVDVRKALEILSREGSLNILVSPGVNGRVTANLKGLSPDEALDAIAKLCGLMLRRDRGIIYVYTAQEMAPPPSRESKEPKFVTRVYHLNYIKSADVEKMVKPLLGPLGKIAASPNSEVGIPGGGLASSAGGTPGGSGGSSGGQPGGGTPGGSSGGGSSGGSGASGGGSGSTGGNSLAGGETVIIRDLEPVMEEVDKVIAQLDVQPAQVLIEAVILSVTLTRDNEFGVNFGVVDAARTILGVVGNGAIINASVGFDPASVLTAGGQVQGNFAAPEHGLKFGFVDKDVTGFLRAVQTIGKVDVLATPRLLVLNKQKAQLQLGNVLGYSTFSQSSISTVQQIQFLPVGTLLRVRPFISTDGMVRMEIHPERSSGQLDQNGIPQTNTTELTTNVMVPDGATIVIGGLMDNEEDKNQQGTPILSDIPLLGVLFRQRQQTNTKKELVVLLTPHIWVPSAAHASTGHALPASASNSVSVGSSHDGRGFADLAISIHQLTPVQVGEQGIYDVQITNRGNVAARDVAVSAEFDSGLNPVAAEGPTRTVIERQKISFEPLLSFEPEAQTMYRIQAHALLSGTHLLRVKLTSPSLSKEVEVEESLEVLPKAAPEVEASLEAPLKRSAPQ